VRSSYSRRLVSTPDGGTISLDWWNGSLENDLAADVPVLLCLHAFAGVLRHTHMTHAVLTESESGHICSDSSLCAVGQQILKHGLHVYRLCWVAKLRAEASLDMLH